MAYPDFDLSEVDSGGVPAWPVESVEELGVEFVIYESFKPRDATTELVARVPSL